MKHGIYQGQVPLFYVKTVGNSSSAHLGHGHEYLFSRTTDDEVAKELERLLEIRKKSEREFWETIIFKYTIIPVKLLKKKTTVSYTGRKDDDNDSEKWFRGAWFMGTYQLFERYPHLEMYEEIPYDLIKEIMHGPSKKQEPKKTELTKSSKVEDSVKADDKPAKAKKALSVKDKIKKKKSKTSHEGVSSSEGTNKASKKDVLSRLKKKKKESKVKSRK